MAATPSGKGYWLVTASGGIFCFGDARSHGSTAARHLTKPIVGMAATPSGKGYWLVTSGGGVHSFGDAKPHGSIGNAAEQADRRHRLDPFGQGLLARDRGRRCVRLRRREAATAGTLKTSAPVVTIARTPTGNGYWLAANDGTVGAFGDAPKLGCVKAPTAVLVRC